MDVLNSECPKLPWMIDFYSSEDGKVLNSQCSAAFAENGLRHLSNLNIKSKAPIFRSTQLVCTVPLKATCNTIEELMINGMSVARISAPGNDTNKLLELVTKIRTILEAYSRKIGRIYPLAFALDVKGPEIRTGQLEKNKEEIFLPKGKVTTLTTDEAYEEFVSEDMIFVDYSKLPEIVQPGDKVLLEYGELHLSAIEVAESIIRCIVEKAGRFFNRSSVIVPNAPIDLPVVSDEDKSIIQMALKLNIDFLMVSGIHNSQNIADIRKLVSEDGDKISIISKIENSLAVENIDEIIACSDAIFVDCERLLVEIPKEKVFLVQKSILAKCNLSGVPVICSTNINNVASLSKSEVCDIANSIIDGADALLIHQNVCAKEIVKEVAVVCKEAEPAVYQRQIFNELIYNIPTPNEAIYSLCISAVEASLKSSAAAIICLTTSGRTAKVLSRFKPRCPIITITRYPRIARSLRLNKGVEPLIYLKTFDGNWNKDVDERIQLGITYGKHLGYIRMGDAVVTVSGSKPEVGLPNNIKVVFASDYDTLVKRMRSN
ncbi:pyruvate kinase-like [Sitophilus oryzae]|uniref:Pyruvate kinase n=1 Tax=Sitophilus oryzae TaxID=7048 RepID=A0A6J2YI67_SITOR|nr:pyruvate kinase-like [Sitophilus oryzae]